MADKITSQDIVHAYMSYYRYYDVRSKGISPLLSFLLLDLSYNMLRKTMQGIKFKQETKQLKNKMFKQYTEINHIFFLPMKDDYEDYIIELMNSLEEFLNRDIVIMQCSIARCIQHDDTKMRELMSDMLTAHVLCEMATTVWDEIYRKYKNIDPVYQKMLNFEDTMFKLINKLHSTKSNIVLNNSQLVHDSAVVLCNKSIRWAMDTN